MSMPSMPHVVPAQTRRQVGSARLGAALLGVALSGWAHAAWEDAGAAGPALPVLAPGGEVEPGVRALVLDPAAYESLRGLNRFRLANLPLGSGPDVSLMLDRVEVFTDDARIVAREGQVETPLARPDVQTFAGEVEGEPGSMAYLAVSPWGTSGIIRRAAGTSIISSGPAGASQPVVYDTFGPLARGADIEIPACAGGIIPEGEALGAPNSGGYGPRGSTCRAFRLAVECDTEFTANPFGGNQTAATAYVATLVGAMTEIYRRDVNAGFQIAYLRLWTGDDPYTQTGSSAQLGEFRAYWNANMTGVSRDLAHFLSPRGLGGGVAYRPGLCSTNAYGLSGNLAGFFPYPTLNNHAQNWDIMVISHEIGHNINSGHTHEPASYNPPIDGCGNAYLNPPQTQDCTAADLNIGTIMSYCHLCSGGMTNMRMEFGPRPSTVIRNYIDLRTTCGITPSLTISQQPGSLSPCAGDAVSLSIVASGTGTRTYQWFRNGVAIAGATGPTHAFSMSAAAAGSYTVSVTATCVSFTSDPAIITLGSCSCDPDVNADGNVDQGDVDYLINVVGGGSNPSGVDPDFNRDGNVDQGDVGALVNVVAGGACP